MTENNNIVSKISQLLEEFGVPKVSAKNLKYNFVNQGDMDSFGILSFITEVEALMGIEITPKDLTKSSIQTIAGLADLVEKKIQGGAKI